MEYHKWITVYQCECGKFIENGVGKWDDVFFLPDACSNCGRAKGHFKKLGVAYWTWTPRLFDWFEGTYVYRKD